MVTMDPCLSSYSPNYKSLWKLSDVMENVVRTWMEWMGNKDISSCTLTLIKREDNIRSWDNF
jgi:hypothetical protein